MKVRSVSIHFYDWKLLYVVVSVKSVELFHDLILINRFIFRSPFLFLRFFYFWPFVSIFMMTDMSCTHKNRFPKENHRKSNYRPNWTITYRRFGHSWWTWTKSRKIILFLGNTLQKLWQITTVMRGIDQIAKIFVSDILGWDSYQL